MQNSIDVAEAYIRLCDVDDASKVWEVPLWSAIVIGRSNDCRIQVSEKSVSREHCRIFINGSAFIENISLTNITALNGAELTSLSPLNPGDRIGCGRITFLVEDIHLPEGDSYVDGTAYINV